MSVKRVAVDYAYGISDALIPLAPLPIVASRDPETNDFAQLGTADANAMAPFATSNFDPQMISQLSRPEYKAFVKSLTPDQYQMLFGSKQFGDLYDKASKSNQFNFFQPY